MNRFARAACAAATTVVLASVTPAVPASTAPDRGAREVGRRRPPTGGCRHRETAEKGNRQEARQPAAR